MNGFPPRIIKNGMEFPGCLCSKLGIGIEEINSVINRVHPALNHMNGGLQHLFPTPASLVFLFPILD
jgi:hypothetical protein